ncbi:MAG: glycoside hydrolase family 92 protein, partial [Mucinivorans sp.]
TKYFSNTPAGLPGNDDAGTMSAWQNLSMMGIYPPCPARAEYVITTPSFDKVTIKLDGSFYNRKELVIEAINRSDENIYIERIELDGKAYKSRFISHEKLTNAGRLTIYCTNKH